MRVFRPLFVIISLVVSAAAQLEPISIPDDSKFSSDAVFDEAKDGSDAVISSGTKNGVRYKISHRMALGSVEGYKGSELILGPLRPGSEVWQLACNRSPKSESKQCMIVRNGIAFILQIGKSGQIPWLTASNAQLGTGFPSSIEVDDDIIFRDNKMASDAMERLSIGKKATVRLVDPNVPEGRVISFDLYGFNVAIELCTWAVKEIQ